MACELDPQGVEPRSLLAAADFTNARVLEVGCGDGRLTFRYPKAAAFVAGLETNPTQLASAIATCPAELRQRLGFVQASAMELPFPAGVFDIAVLAKSL